MNKKAKSICLFVSFCLFSPLTLFAKKPDNKAIERILDAIAEIESKNKLQAIGDGGKAIGAYQIHRSYWQDGTRFLKVNWDYSFAFDPVKSRMVVKAYLLHYGKGKTLIDMARIHNGGPNGLKKNSTLAYARKISEILKQLPQSKKAALNTAFSPLI